MGMKHLNDETRKNLGLGMRDLAAVHINLAAAQAALADNPAIVDPICTGIVDGLISNAFAEEIAVALPLIDMAENRLEAFRSRERQGFLEIAIRSGHKELRYVVNRLDYIIRKTACDLRNANPFTEPKENVRRTVLQELGTAVVLSSSAYRLLVFTVKTINGWNESLARDDERWAAEAGAEAEAFASGDYDEADEPPPEVPSAPKSAAPKAA
jgi:hypothetical protein